MYHDDLLEQAMLLVHQEKTKPKQASLRRAVSTAYYAVFHLLIHEAVSNWKQSDLRGSLGRSFDHGNMKSASNRIQDTRQFPFTGENPAVVSTLRHVADSFVRLQGKRHTADYDNDTFWTKTGALMEVRSAQKAFADWHRIRKEPIAQAYLMLLLVKKRD